MQPTNSPITVNNRLHRITYYSVQKLRTL